MAGKFNQMVTVWLVALTTATTLTASAVFAQVEVNSDGSTMPYKQPAPVGRNAAEKYMGVKPNGRSPSSNSIGADTHYLAVHLGTFVDDSAYNWAQSGEANDVGSLSAGVTYRIGEWTNSMDLLFRGDFNSYAVGSKGRLVKLSLLFPTIIFPDAASGFPLYFGAAVGLGVFFKQAEDESALSFDYQILGGVRFFDVFENTGFFFETGMKNHINLLSDGQFNGVFVSVGSVFTF